MKASAARWRGATGIDGWSMDVAKRGEGDDNPRLPRPHVQPVRYPRAAGAIPCNILSPGHDHAATPASRLPAARAVRLLLPSRRRAAGIEGRAGARADDLRGRA